MSKRNLSITIGIGAAFAFAFASVTYAAAVKIKVLVPEVGENEAADGMVILNYSQGSRKTETQVAITGFTPGTTYRVVVVRTNFTGEKQGTVDGQITTIPPETASSTAVTTVMQRLRLSRWRSSSTLTTPPRTCRPRSRAPRIL